MNFLNILLEAQGAVKRIINEILEDKNQSIANKVAAVMFGESSGNRKKALINKLLIDVGLISEDDCLHVKNGSFVASQISVKTMEQVHYVAAIVDGIFCLTMFDPQEAQKIGFSCHGSRQISDACRANVSSICDVVWAEMIDYAK